LSLFRSWSRAKLLPFAESRNVAGILAPEPRPCDGALVRSLSKALSTSGYTGGRGTTATESVLDIQSTNRECIMRVASARALVSVLLLTSAGVALSACRHTANGAAEDIHRDTK
jgi:hypothetical protein